jgi:hypothetical protein
MSGLRSELSWQAALVARHPDLFRMELVGRYQTPGFPEVGDGWRNVVETAVCRIAEAVAAAPPASVKIVQLKEKFATLRLYWHGESLSRDTENAVADAVALAEARSACTCEICGDAGVLHRAGGQLLTACAAHAVGEPVAAEPGWENLHLVRGYRDGKVALILCRRYDREADAFVDVDPRSLGIEE